MVGSEEAEVLRGQATKWIMYVEVVYLKNNDMNIDGGRTVSQVDKYLDVQKW